MKKLFSLLLTFAMLVGILSMFSFVSSADGTPDTPFTKGDVNGDGFISVKDSLLMKKYFVGAASLNSTQLTAADINLDGHVTTKDNKYLIGYIVCTLNSFEASELSKVGLTDGRSDVKIGGNTLNSTNYCIVMPIEFKNSNIPLNSEYNAPKSFHFAVRRLKGLMPPGGLNIVAANDSATLANYSHKIYCQADSTGLYGEEGFNISTNNGDVYLTCSADSTKPWTQRGMFYAVYTFLEDYFDIKFYEDYEYYAPYRSSGINIPDGIDRTETPGFNYRCSAGWSFSENNPYEQSRWYNITRKINAFDGNYSMNSPQIAYAKGALHYHAHSLGQYLGTPNVNPCLSSDATFTAIKAAIKAEIDDRRSWGNGDFWSDQYQYITQISCSIEDVVTVHACETCKARYRQYGCFNGLYMEFVNKIAAWLDEEYPGAGYKTFSVLYDHLVPTGITPRSNEIWCYCGTGCNNHTIENGHGTNDTCTTPGCVVAALGNSGNLVADGQVSGKLNDGVNTVDKNRLVSWTNFLHTSGAEFYFWYYPTNVHYNMCPTPNYTNIYYDFKYLHDIGVDGIYCEGDSHRYAMEGLREYLAAEMLWNPTMSYAKFEELMDEYLMAHCGEGWRYIREYITMYEYAGDLQTCWINNYDSPWEMVNRQYFRNNYDTMRGLFDSAYSLASTNKQREYILKARIHCDFLGLSAQFNGSSLSSTNRNRYADLLSYLRTLDSDDDDDGNLLSSTMGYTLPSTPNYSQDPMEWYDAWAGDTYPGAHRQSNFN